MTEVTSFEGTPSELDQETRQGLIVIVDQLMENLYIEYGEVIPAMNIWEETRSIEVIPINREVYHFELRFRIGDNTARLEWKLNPTDIFACGVIASDFGNFTINDLLVAAGLVLGYYGQAKAQ